MTERGGIVAVHESVGDYTVDASLVYCTAMCNSRLVALAMMFESYRDIYMSRTHIPTAHPVPAMTEPEADAGPNPGGA